MSIFGINSKDNSKSKSISKIFDFEEKPKNIFYFDDIDEEEEKAEDISNKEDKKEETNP